MTTYTITSKTSGLELGQYQGETIERAADALARDAGYRDADHMDDVTRADWRDEMIIVEAAQHPLHPHRSHTMTTVTAEIAALVRDTLSSPEPQSFTRPEFLAWNFSGATGDAVTSGELTRADAETAVAEAYDVLSPLFKRVRDAQAECLDHTGDQYEAESAAQAAWSRGVAEYRAAHG